LKKYEFLKILINKIISYKLPPLLHPAILFKSHSPESFSLAVTGTL
jgi:hypothetical protein